MALSLLSKKQFLTLNAIRQTPKASQRFIAEQTGLSLGTVNTAVRELEDARFIQDGQLTSTGLEALVPHKVNNAIIMAAGLSSRFAPISYEKPKGLTRVRGEVLIERQIRQLREAGIDDITVVVGYKKECFFYLERAFGVRIVINDEYASRNNNSSLWRVRDLLANTYICSSDDYFTENPFEPFVWRAYYAAQWADGPTAEWCIETGAQNRITGVTIGGQDAWYMLGHVYFDRAFSERFRAILEAEYHLPETAPKLWEEIFLAHADELDMRVRPYPAGVINEFDSLDELRAFDPLFLENVDSEIFDNICSVLGCEKSEIHDVWPLKQGLTNLSCHFSTNNGEWVYRHPGVGTGELVDRSAEATALKVAASLGLDETFVHADPVHGWKISRYIPDAQALDAHDPVQRAQAMKMCRELHESDAAVERTFDFYAEGRRYESLLRNRKPLDIPGWDEMSAQITRLEDYVRADNAPICLNHNDFFGLNFLVEKSGKCHLIDWEYAGMSDHANDFGTFCVCEQLDDSEVEDALAAYLGRMPAPAERRHFLAHICLAGWCWYAWSLLKETEGDFVGEWLYIYYRYAEKYLDIALALYEKSAE